jgi:hypothetical protein
MKLTGAAILVSRGMKVLQAAPAAYPYRSAVEAKPMNLSALALAIYDILRDRVPDSGAEITYSELVNDLGPLPPPNEGLHYRDARLDEALGELVAACRARWLPAISALVIREVERNPGAGYYPTAHPAEWAQDRMLAEVAWANEREQARQTSYPAQL